ncbi:hypothetical protein Dtox_0213 [Desulfofarcimen acetoxidans DSM 771]|jgi:uncharacterized CHY-type Zn-finger protein|uniref:Uncharacterized protein n=1 Tax=Desulfofarcimen acetoxidans (strain ATCC 49208 / DSM 771 / KCTC 5769 / VKM B-1644 / 5575) TaxID=485916 RepID=C8W310_DESAS|nr:hypothetical protein [Desulfofarcimen acetoxidans]ACV61166.1 hypothetical protein Dtox_0213 [Desulfofarcimen acetoxidans DSM 771]
MKVYYVCECCDEVFDIVDSATCRESGQEPSLTGISVCGIINGVSSSDGYYVSGICPDCREEINCGYDTVFYREPVIN